jgi:hypothetical protein
MNGGDRHDRQHPTTTRPDAAQDSGLHAPGGGLGFPWRAAARVRRDFAAHAVHGRWFGDGK